MEGETLPSVKDVIVTDRLAERPGRSPDHVRESRMLGALAAELAERPENLLQRLCDLIIETDPRLSAGVSLDEEANGARQFRWVALSGAWAHLRGDAMPHDASPCGVVVARDRTMLFENPERVFPAARVEPLIQEVLLVPFHAEGRPVGTLWINAHDPGRRFDREDLRLLQSLARFASAGFQMERALAAAQASEKASKSRYHALFGSIDNGFCIVEVLFDAEGRPVDYVFVEQNAAFAAQTGLGDAVGRRMRELRPEHEGFWFEVYGRVARTGRPVRFEHEAKALGRWFDVSAFPVEEQDNRHVAILFNNVTERKRAEAALRDSEARFRAFVNASSDVVYRMSPDWSEMRELDGQGFLADTTGPSETWMDRYIPPDDQPLVRAAIDRTIETKAVLDLEHRVRKADGDLGWTHSRAVPILDERGKITEWLGAASDVTGRKRAEEALRESEGRFRAIVERARDYAIFTADIEGRIDNWPPGAEAVFGWSAEEAVGQPVDITYTSEDRANNVPAKERETALAEGQAPNVRWHARKDGSPVFIEGIMRPLDGGGGPMRGFLKVGQDVTERHAAREALRESEELFRSFAETSTDTLWIINAETGQLEYLSPAFERMWGEKRDTILADLDRWTALVHPADREKASHGMPCVLAGESFVGEYRIVRPADGGVRWIRDTGFPIKDADGRVRRAGGIAQDVTEEKKTADRMHVLVAELQHRTRNLMGVVRSMVDKTGRASSDLADFRRRFRDRLDALARVQGFLSRLGNGDRVTFDELMEAEFAAMDGGARRVTLDGPRGVRLRSSTVQTLGLALHELATNAVKYGALSQPTGRLAVSWRVEPDAARERSGAPWLSIDWRESGVKMAGPFGGGQGRELIERALPYQLDARTTYEIGPDGVHCTIAIPISTSTPEGEKQHD